MLRTESQSKSWPFIGQENLGGYLLQALSSKRLPRAILFAGPKSLGKSTAALWLSRRALCRSTGTRPCETCVDCRQSNERLHPHQIVVQASESGRITIEAIRQALSTFIVVGSAERERWLIVPDAERLTESAANTLLKFIEELPSHTRVIMTTSQVDSMVPTLRSRLTVFFWHLVPASTLRKTAKASVEATHRAAGRPGWLLGDAEMTASFSDTWLHDVINNDAEQGRTNVRQYPADKAQSSDLLKTEELLVRELLLRSCGSDRRALWPASATHLSTAAAAIGVFRLINLAERYLDRYEFSLNIQPRLLYEDLHLV